MRTTIAFLFALVLSASVARAQAPAPQTIAPALVDAAKREGKLTWYTSVPVETAQKISNLFQEKTGIKVELFRSGGSNILRRFQQEADGGKIFVDVLTHSEPAAARMMTKKGLFVAFKAADFDKVPNEVKDPDGYHVAQRLNVMAMYLRDDKVAAADYPKNWADLMSPKYKGMQVMADPSFTAIQLVVVSMLSKRYGWQYYEALRRNNVMIVQGHEQIFDMVKRGERLVAAEASDPRIYTGGVMPPNMINIIPAANAIQVPSPSAIVKGSPHPNAAKLFAQYNLQPDIQHKFTEEGHHSPRIDVAPPPGLPPLSALELDPIDYDYIEANTRQIKAKFAEIFQ
jgi:iron(III) transport system substrate-binding protein